MGGVGNIVYLSTIFGNTLIQVRLIGLKMI